MKGIHAWNDLDVRTRPVVSSCKRHETSWKKPQALNSNSLSFVSAFANTHLAKGHQYRTNFKKGKSSGPTPPLTKRLQHLLPRPQQAISAKNTLDPSTPISHPNPSPAQPKRPKNRETHNQSPPSAPTTNPPASQSPNASLSLQQRDTDQNNTKAHWKAARLSKCLKKSDVQHVYVHAEKPKKAQPMETPFQYYEV